jgi:flagellar hook protein FlgE
MTLSLTRNGQLVPDKNSFIVDAEGNKLMGFVANAQGQLNKGQIVLIQIPNSSLLPPQATTKAAFGINLDSGATTSFNVKDSTSFNFTTSIQAFDSLGTPTTVNVYLEKT